MLWDASFLRLDNSYSPLEVFTDVRSGVSCEFLITICASYKEAVPTAGLNRELPLSTAFVPPSVRALAVVPLLCSSLSSTDKLNAQQETRCERRFLHICLNNDSLLASLPDAITEV